MSGSLQELVAGRFITEWASQGAELRFPCPLCNDHKPRLYLNVRSGRWICFNCDERGAVLSFLERVLGYDPFEASRLAKKLNMSRKGEVVQEAAQTVALPGLPLDDPSDEYQAPFFGYLLGRGVTGEQITYYRMRYSLLGKYGGRVIIPVVMGSFTRGFVARTIRGAEPKDLHPFGMHTSELLFGLDEVQGEEVILTEGIFDAIPLRGQAVATFGAHLSPRQRDLIRSAGITRVVLLWDGDEAGWRATVKRCRELALSGFTTKVAAIPAGEDPASINNLERLALTLQNAFEIDPVLPERMLRRELERKSRGGD